MTEDPGKGAPNVIEHQAGTVIEESEAAAVAGIMTVEVAMIATMTEKVDMTGKRTRNQGDLVVVAMIQGVAEGHVLETMIDMGVMTIEIGTRCRLVSLDFRRVLQYSQ